MPEIVVLSGVNGAGKSSVAGAALRAGGGDYFNPDEMARRYRALCPAASQEQANGWAWEQGRKRLEAAISGRLSYHFETTLGGRTITDLLLRARRSGIAVRVFHVGLVSPELHLARVRQRVESGGHDIPEAKILERWEGSRRNLILLLPELAELKVFDNSAEGNPADFIAPQPRLVIHLKDGKIVAMVAPGMVPDWAKAIVQAAVRLDTTGGFPGP